MSRFLILFNAPEPMSVFMAQSTPEERQAGMQAWMSWKAEADKTVRFEFGSPVEAVSHIDPNDNTYQTSFAANYAFIEAENKEAVINALNDHPHLQRPGSSIDVLELLSMPR